MESAESKPETSQISVTSRVPDFWTDQPRIWFIQVEAVLTPHKILDEAKYNLVVTKLGKKVIAQVTDILISPPEANKYGALKNKLLEIYEESESRKIQKLIGEIDLGERKPSQLLRVHITSGSPFLAVVAKLIKVWS